MGPGRFLKPGGCTRLCLIVRRRRVWSAIWKVTNEVVPARQARGERARDGIDTPVWEGQIPPCFGFASQLGRFSRLAWARLGVIVRQRRVSGAMGNLRNLGFRAGATLHGKNSKSVHIVSLSVAFAAFFLAWRLVWSPQNHGSTAVCGGHPGAGGIDMCLQ